VLAKSNIQRPYIRFEKCASFRSASLEVKGLSKSYDDLRGDSEVQCVDHPWRKIAMLDGTGPEDDHVAVAAPQCHVSWMRPDGRFIDSGVVTWGHEVAVGFSRRIKESIQPGATLLEWLHEFDPTSSQQELRGLLGQCIQRRGTRPSAPRIFRVEKPRVSFLAD